VFIQYDVWLGIKAMDDLKMYGGKTGVYSGNAEIRAVREISGEPVSVYLLAKGPVAKLPAVQFVTLKATEI
jgi:hypothetical protein